MVPAVDGRSGSRTAIERRWYRPSMVMRVRQAGPTGLLALSMAVAGCLPAARTTQSTGVPSPDAIGSSAPGSSPVVAPSASPHAEIAAIDAFAKLASSGKLTYHVAFTGEVRASVNRLPIAGAMDVAGNDFSSTFTYDFNPDYPGLGKVRVQVRGVDSHGWIKRGSAAWSAMKTYGVDQSYVPFKSVEAPTDVKYLGPVKIAGATYYKIGVPHSLLIHPNTIPYQIQREEVRETELQVVIDAAGEPRSGTWSLRGQARIGAGEGQLQHVEYTLTLTFSKVGAKISVKRP